MKSLVNVKNILLLAGLFFILSCEKPDIADDPVLVEQLMVKSSDTIQTDSHKYFLETELSRNLMPGGPVAGRRKLVAYITMVNADRLPVSPYISIAKLYVINKTTIWTSVPQKSSSLNIPDYKFPTVSTGGPEWQIDIYVDVVAEVFNDQTKQKILIKILNQKIEALY